jgi:hypothetical protein
VERRREEGRRERQRKSERELRGEYEKYETI